MAIPAATLILLRGTVQPEVLMVERGAGLAFAGGACVFPGGRIDPGDAAMALGMGDAALAARIAAIRETIEETGIAPATTGADPVSVRDRLAAGGGLDVAIGSGRVSPERLRPYARWRPDLPHARVFDTQFFVARADADAPPPSPDGRECARAFWVRPGAMLAAADRGEARLIFPTRRVLERLACHPDAAAVLADADRWPDRTITPWIEVRGGVEHLCIPDDLGYPITAEPMHAVTRG